MALNFVFFILGLLVFNFIHNYWGVPRTVVNPKEIGFLGIKAAKEKRKAKVQDDEKAIKSQNNS